MRPYTPAEILQAGATDTRRAHEHLVIELEALHAGICWHWHRTNIDEDVPLLDGEERLPRHPAPAGFGGNTVAIPPRPVPLSALTAAGRQLYELGGQAARRERECLVERILIARREHDDARTCSTRSERAALVAATLHAADAARHRHTPNPPTPVTADRWAIRIPGTAHWETTTSRKAP